MRLSKMKQYCPQCRRELLINWDGGWYCETGCDLADFEYETEYDRFCDNEDRKFHIERGE